MPDTLATADAALSAAHSAVPASEDELFDVLTACGWSAADAQHVASAPPSACDPAERRWLTGTQYAAERLADTRTEHDHAVAEHARGPLYADDDAIDRAADTLAYETARRDFHRAQRDPARLRALAHLTEAHAADRSARFDPDARVFGAPATAWRALARVITAALTFIRPSAPTTPAPRTGPALGPTHPAASPLPPRLLARVLCAAPAAPPACAVAARV